MDECLEKEADDRLGIQIADALDAAHSRDDQAEKHLESRGQISAMTVFIRSLSALSGILPKAALAFSSICAGLLVSVRTQVMAGCGRMYFNEN